MTSKRLGIFLMILLLQVLVIVGMVGKKQWVLRTGRAITLRTEAYDPTEIFRGHYAVFNFPINWVEVSHWTPWPPKREAPVYVILKEQNNHWEFASVHSEFPSSVAPEQIVLRGVVTNHQEIRGQPVVELTDLTQPGWLATQPEDALWRLNTMLWPRRRLPDHNLYWMDYQKHLPVGAPIYVHLVCYDKQDKLWTLQGIDESPQPNPMMKANPNAKEMILQGKLGKYQERQFLRVEYGIENYFISEMKSEWTFQRGNVEVSVRIGANGEAVIESVRLPEKAR